jgi:hypothetical protein
MQVMHITLWACTKCDSSYTLPQTVCRVCDRPAWLDEQRRFRDDAVDLLAMNVDMYNDSFLFWDGERFFRCSGQNLRTASAGRARDLGGECQRLQDELRDVLAENARMRRKLEGK